MEEIIPPLHDRISARIRAFFSRKSSNAEQDAQNTASAVQAKVTDQVKETSNTLSQIKNDIETSTVKKGMHIDWVQLFELFFILFLFVFLFTSSLHNQL